MANVYNAESLEKELYSLNFKKDVPITGRSGAAHEPQFYRKDTNTIVSYISNQPTTENVLRLFAMTADTGAMAHIIAGKLPTDKETIKFADFYKIGIFDMTKKSINRFKRTLNEQSESSTER